MPKVNSAKWVKNYKQLVGMTQIIQTMRDAIYIEWVTRFYHYESTDGCLRQMAMDDEVMEDAKRIFKRLIEKEWNI